MSTTDASTSACAGNPGAPSGPCDECALGCAVSAPSAASPCGNDGGTATAEERATVAASGAAVALLAAAVVMTGGGRLQLLTGGSAVLSGLVLSLLGGIALRRGGRLGDRLLLRATALLPWATGLLLVGMLARLVGLLAGTS